MGLPPWFEGVNNKKVQETEDMDQFFDNVSSEELEEDRRTAGLILPRVPAKVEEMAIIKAVELLNRSVTSKEKPLLEKFQRDLLNNASIKATFSLFYATDLGLVSVEHSTQPILQNTLLLGLEKIKSDIGEQAEKALVELVSSELFWVGLFRNIELDAVLIWAENFYSEEKTGA